MSRPAVSSGGQATADPEYLQSHSSRWSCA